MTEVKNLTEYMGVESKPKRNNIPWSPEEVEELCKEASAFYKNDGDPQISFLAAKFNRTEGAITVKLSKENWFKDNGLGWNNKKSEGTLKTQILDYVKNNPWCFSKDVNKALNVKSTSTLSTLYKEGLLQRVKHHGNGAYLYSFNDISVHELAEEVITELGDTPGNIKVIKSMEDVTEWTKGDKKIGYYAARDEPNKPGIFTRLGKFLSELIGG
jgi:hypothetical protein